MAGENNKIEIVLSLNGKQYRADMAGATKDTEKFIGSTNRSVTSVTHLASAIKLAVGGFAGLKLAGQIKESTLLAARNETLGVTLETVGRNAGKTAGEMFGYAEAVEQMGITTQVARQIVVRMTQAQLDLTKASQLARVAQDAAVVGNVNSSEALDRLLNGIVTLQPEILRNIGITVSFEQEYAKFARTANRTVDSLTQNEKQQIAFNAAMREGEKLAGTYERAMDTAGKQLGSWERDLEELSAAFGARFLPALAQSVPLVRELTQWLTELLRPDHVRPLNELTQELADLKKELEFSGPGLEQGLIAGRISHLENVIGEMRLARGEAGALTDRLSELDGQIASLREKSEDVTERLSRARQFDSEISIPEFRGTEGIDRFSESSKLLIRQRSINQQLQELVDERQEISRRLQAAQDQSTTAIQQSTQDSVDRKAEKQREKIDQLIRNMEREIALFGDSTNAAAIRYDLEANALGEVTQGQERLLIKRAQELDSLEAVNKELESMIENNDELFAFEGIEASLDNASQQIQAFADQAARNIQSALADFLFDPFDDGLDGMAAKFADTIQRMAAEVAAARVLNAAFTSQGLGGVLGNIFGVGASADLDRLMSDSELFAFHSGGVVGQDGISFAHAKRLHSGGLASNEVPAILKKDEGVFTPAQMRALGNGRPTVNVNLYQDASRAGEVNQTTRDDGVNIDIFVAQIEGRVARNVLSMGDIGHAVSTRFGLNPVAGAV